jgi:ATP-dependent exoDNAse (exonuclease V) alpha subunit
MARVEHTAGFPNRQRQQQIRTSMSEDDATRWADIASAYALGVLSVRQICAQHSISSTALYRRAAREGWPKRLHKATARRQQERPAAPSARNDKANLIARLYRALERKMSEFEDKQSEGAASAAESERNARTLNTMVRLFERLQAMEEKALEPAGKVRRGDGTRASPEALSAADADRLRDELARRLERLRAECSDF